jgi:hypothetical protein
MHNSIHRTIRTLGGSRFYSLMRLSKRISALEEWGWFESMRREHPCDKYGQPMPWMAYPAISILENRAQRSWSVFEFGSGYSTLWWARRVDRVIACEHNEGWAKIVRQKLNPPASLIEIPLDDSYPLAALRSGLEYNLIAIDGRKRSRCALNSIGALTQDGVLLWDDSDRHWYQDGIETCLSRGFKRLDLVGFSPLMIEPKQTSILYRPNNCLGI